MSDKIKISIIVPVHNAADSLERCIKSISGQSYGNIECILVENASTDNSLALCQKYAGTYDYIKVATSEQKGVSAARNIGLSMATGDIIGFCDADDFYEKDAFSTIVSAFMNNPDIIGVMTAFYVGKEINGTIKKKYRGIKKTFLTAEEAIALTIGEDNVLGSVCNRFYRAEVAKKIAFNCDLSYSEDTHYNVSLLSRYPDTKLIYISKSLYCYVMNSQSVTHTASTFFDDKDNLKYIVTLYTIIDECKLNERNLSIAKMKIAKLAIDYLYKIDTNPSQKEKLLTELKLNRRHLFVNLFRFNLQNDIKSIIKGIIVLMKLIKQKWKADVKIFKFIKTKVGKL